MRKPNKYQLAFLKWRRKQRNNKMMPLLLSLIVGLVVGLAAILIKTIIYYIEEYAIRFFPNILFIFIPLAGLLLVTFLNKNVFNKTVNFRGTRNVIDAIENKSSILNFRLMYSKFITTGISIGFGGSSGVEAAIITTGSAIGSNTGQFLGLGYKLRTLLIGCGIASGISAVYNAPVGGFLFALETILPEFTPTLLIPLLVSAVCGKILFEVFMGDQLRFDAPLPDFTYDQLPFVLILGVIGMITAIYLNKTYQFCYKWLSKLKNAYVRALIGGLALGSVIYLFPAMYGEGYVSINSLLDGNEIEVFSNSIFGVIPHTSFSDLAFFLALILAKPLSTGLSVNSGGEGGYFAPSIITGGFLGYFFYKGIYLFAPGADQVVSPITYIYLGMAGMFACVMNAPITAIFLIAEITQSYQLFVPLMLVSATSYFLKYYLENLQPKDVKRQRNSRFMRMERIALNHIHAADLIEKDYFIAHPHDSLRELVEAFSESPMDVAPVLDEENAFLGIITLQDIREHLLSADRQKSIEVREIMKESPVTIGIHDPTLLIIEKFEQANSPYLPVLYNGKLKGLISRIDVLTRYRNELTKSNRYFG